MKVYGLDNKGCFVLIIIMALLVTTVGFFGRILFTTPIGIAILIAFGIKYILDQRKKSLYNVRSSEFVKEEDSKFDSDDYRQSDNSFDRSDYLDVEEVSDYKEIEK